MHTIILEKIKKFWLSKFVFNKVYIDSILDIIRTLPHPSDSNYEMARSIDLQSET